MKLTIGMIVKNEEKYLERCLTALKPILDNVDSELIITDTGSTDRTVEIAERFTDKVLHFEWINDFAAARNTGLEAAKGEWFMFVDADEIFQSCDNIIDFFNSGEYKGYDAASFVRTELFFEKDETVKSSSYIIRLAKMSNETKFIGAIHEQLVPLKSKIKVLYDEIDHYGYLFDTDEDRKRKGKRNLEILLKEVEQEPEFPQTYERIFDTYRVLNEDEKALEYLDEAIKICKKYRYDFILTLLTDKALYYFSKTEYENSIEVCSEYFECKSKYKIRKVATDAEVLAIKANSLYASNRHSEAIDTYISFFNVFLDLKSGKLSTLDMYYISFAIAVDSNFLQIISLFIESCIKENQFDVAKKYVFNLPIDKFCNDDKQIAFIVDSEMKLLRETTYQDAVNYYDTLNDTGKIIFNRFLAEEIFVSDNKKALIGAVSEIGKIDKIVFNNILPAVKIIDNAIKLRENKNFKECISEMKRAVSIYESLAPTVSEYCNEVVAEYEREAKAEPQDEMKKLAVAIKSNIRAYIESGNIEAARKTLDEFRKIMPGDSDIIEIEDSLKNYR